MPAFAAAEPAPASLPPPVASIPSEMTDRRRVAFIPFYTDNPYQRELATHLQPLGIQVVPRPWLKDLPRDVWRGRERLDLIHLHWLPIAQRGISGRLRSTLFLARLATLKLRGCRVIWTVHNLQHHESPCPRLERALARRVFATASRVIVHSPTAAGIVRRTFAGPNDQRIVVVPHGRYVGVYPNDITPAAARQRLGLPAAVPVLLFLGNIRPYKGVDKLIAAFRSLEHPDARLVIAGKPLDAASVQMLEQGRANDSRVKIYPDYIPDDALQDYFNACDAVVFPYQDVLTSGAVVLAMSFGRACIAPSLGCINDLLASEDGLLYDPTNPTALRHTLASALFDRPRLHRIGVSNLARTDPWDWSRVATATAAVYAAAFPRRNHPLRKFPE